MFPLTPALSPKRRGGRPCQYQEREPAGPFLCREPSAYREVAYSPHPNSLPKEERGPAVPRSGEEAGRAIFV